jgi:two-component system chemotaxis sensor kinase CheA
VDRGRLVGLFLGEARDHLAAADESVQRLESARQTGEALRELMRHAHSLKGMAMSLGFSSMEALAHALEDLFESLGESSPAHAQRLVPLARDGLTCLGRIVDAVENGAQHEIEDARALAVRVRSARRDGGREATERSEPRAGMAPAAEDRVESSGPVSRRWKIELLLFRTLNLTATRTVNVLRELGELGAVEHVAPPLQANKGGRFEGRLVLVLASQVEQDELEARLQLMEEVDCFSVQALPHSSSIKNPSGRSTRWARVRADLLDAVLDKAVDLVHEHRRARASERAEELEKRLERSEFLLKELYDALSELRLVPFQTLTQRLNQTVHEVARELAKPVRLRVDGGEIRLDRSVLDALLDPLRHMLRNALDHGVESPHERRAAGKPAEATLSLQIERRGEWVRITLEDDGRGLDAQALKKRAVERGLLDAQRAKAMSDTDAFLLATLPSLSTADRPNRFSGRGVGMDVVRENVERLGGRMSIQSTAGRGTRIDLALPLTLALIQALLVRSAGEMYALPVTRIKTGLSWSDAAGDPDATAPTGAEVVRLSELLGVDRDRESGGAETALVLDVDGRSVGLLVEEVLGRREIVVRPMGPPLTALKPYSGAALLEDGSIVLVLDPDSVVTPASRATSETAHSAPR